VKIAHSIYYGLGAKLWSRDLDRTERLAKRIESRFVFINGMIKSDPRLPFGRVKESGVGRAHSHYKLRNL
jgi:succinate-semialdehyde dehydrogenase/glutarate-semialdehyde dehydrogenase